MPKVEFQAFAPHDAVAAWRHKLYCRGVKAPFFLELRRPMRHQDGRRVEKKGLRILNRAMRIGYLQCRNTCSNPIAPVS